MNIQKHPLNTRRKPKALPFYVIAGSFIVVALINSLRGGTPKEQDQKWFKKGMDLYENQEYAKAAEWFRKAAEQGHAVAQFNLGFMYANGKGVPKNRSKAVEWVHKAAEQGHEDAQFNLGSMYAEGKGVVQDDAKAVEWLRKAAQQGNKKAQEILKELE